ncbi:MAG: acyl carrier protein [Pseudomonadota bacterium]
MANTESVSVIRKIVADILIVPVDRVDCHCTMSQLPKWDSLTFLTLLMMIEEQTGFRLSTDQLCQDNSLADIARILNDHQPTLH